MRQVARVLQQVDPYTRQQDPRVAWLEAHLQGEEDMLRRIASVHDPALWASELSAELPACEAWNEEEERLLVGLMAFRTRWGHPLATVLREHLAREDADPGVMPRLDAIARQHGIAFEAFALETVRELDKRRLDGTPNSALSFILAREDAVLEEVWGSTHTALVDLDVLIDALRATPERLAKLAPLLAKDEDAGWDEREDPATMLLALGDHAVTAALVRHAQVMKTTNGCEHIQATNLLLALHANDPKRWERALIQTATSRAEEEYGEQRGVHAMKLADLLVRRLGAKVLPWLHDLLADSRGRHVWSGDESRLLDTVHDRVGPTQAIELVTALASHPRPEPRIVAFRWARAHLEARTALDDLLATWVRDAIPFMMHGYETQEALGQTFSNWMSPAEITRAVHERWSACLCEALKHAAALGRTELATEVEPLLVHDAAPVRSQAARTYGVLMREHSLETAAALLAQRAAAKRMSGIEIALAVANDEALALLEAHETRETDVSLRTTLMAFLVPLWRARGRELTLVDVDGWIERERKKLARPLAKWLTFEALPELKTDAGRTLTGDQQHWLCMRQAQSPTMERDLEAGVLIDRLEPTSARAWVAALWKRWTTTKMEAQDKWVIALVANLGGDELVAPLHQLAVTWAEKGRGKMSEHVAHALATIGTDHALMLVDDLASRFASKNRNVGAAARDAFERAARERGITVDELGDLVIPRLGFETDVRELDCGGRTLELRIGSDLKLRTEDPVTKRVVKTLPKTTPAALKVELKQLGATLRQAVKVQTARHERMLITERRWSTPAWKALYGNHPVLRPFTERLVWFQEAAERRTFRRLEDGSFTSADDEAFSLGDSGGIGLVHPLDLAHESLLAWREHLADHEVTPPFLQLERPVHALPDDRREARELTILDRVRLAAGTFRGRAERRGWRRGSVVDAGGITSYVRSFPKASVDVLLFTENFYIGIDPTDEVTLGKVWFVHAGSVEFGSYVYDEPERTDDPRVIPLGELPAVVYSETMTDLLLIQGSSGAVDEED